MNLEGIGALAAAAVAGVGIPTTLVLGQWQLRGAKETARAGLAQADASYRAALDAVRAQGHNDHLHWRRGVQRDAYAAFLQSVLSYTDTARDDFSGSTLRLEETQNRIAALKALETDMSHRAWVVRLEGPDGVAVAAVRLQMSARVAVLGEQRHALRMAAMREVSDRARPHEMTRIWELVPVVQGFWRTIGTSAMEDSSEELLQELRDLFSACEVTGGLLVTLCEPDDPAPESVPSFRDASNEFVRAASQALEPAGPPASAGMHPL